MFLLPVVIILLRFFIPSVICGSAWYRINKFFYEKPFNGFYVGWYTKMTGIVISGRAEIDDYN